MITFDLLLNFAISNVGGRPLSHLGILLYSLCAQVAIYFDISSFELYDPLYDIFSSNKYGLAVQPLIPDDSTFSLDHFFHLGDVA